MNRDQFLKSKWEPYPTAPASHQIKGRVDRLSQTYQIPEEWRTVLKPGDWISAKTEGSQITELVLLAPDLSAAGSKSVSDSVWQAHAQFQVYLRLVKDYFMKLNFHEVHTPTLVVSPGTEPYLDVFSTEFSCGRNTRKYYLPTSPELHLKKIMANRGENIFEVRPCFRNGELGALHQPEFWMLEFYRAFENLESIKQDIVGLVTYLAEKMNLSAPVRVSYKTMADLFLEKLNVGLTPQTTREDLLRLALEQKLRVDPETSWDDLFFFLFLEKIERFLPAEELLFLNKYPPSQAALARLTEDGWGDRFEVYWKGLELGNAFHELNDPKIQKQRFEQDLVRKRQLGKEPVAFDLDFLKALESGMPPSAGIAIGLERLFMALTGYREISDFRLFPVVIDPK